MIKENPLYLLSFDNENKISICEYSNIFIDLDNSKGVLKKAQTPPSPDMLYINDKKREIWFVEFKSSNKRNLDVKKEKIKLKKKLFSALFLIYEIFCKDSCKYRDYEKFYFVVYNKIESKSFEDEFLSLGDEIRSIEFGLEDLKPQFVKEVFTENCDSFINLFSKRFNINFTKEKNESK